MKTAQEYINNGFIFCVPSEVKLNLGVIRKYLCNLKCNTDNILIQVMPANLFLAYNYTAVDDNGDIITSTDSDIDKKMVVCRNLELWNAVIQSGISLQNVYIEVLDKMPKYQKRY